jgi:dsDNA-binding SOS-regulon protein
MVDLLKLIKSRPLKLPTEPPLCPELADCLKRMLVADVKRRIEWHELFKHPATSLLNRRKVSEAELELIEDESLMLNTSKCYLKNNLVLADPVAIKHNAQVNEYLVDIIRTGKKPAREVLEQERAEEEEEEEARASKVSRHNSKAILHFRNIYAFLASVADTVINRTEEQHHEIAAYVLVRKILSMIKWLLEATKEDHCSL